MIVWTANFGRGVDAARFTTNARAVLNLPGNRDHVSVWGIQELDEADAPDEHGIVSTLITGVTRVGWHTMEPLLVGERYDVLEHRITHASDGLAKWAPEHYWVQALVQDPDRNAPPVVVMNAHSPRRHSVRPAVRSIVSQYDHARTGAVGYWLGRGYTVIGTEDANTTRPPKAHPKQQTILRSGVDHIWCVQHPRGARVDVAATGDVPLTIDGHDAHWARVKLTPPKETP